MEAHPPGRAVLMHGCPRAYHGTSLTRCLLEEVRAETGERKRGTYGEMGAEAGVGRGGTRGARSVRPDCCTEPAVCATRDECDKLWN